MDAEERELQIKLAQLNARLQIYIAGAFGFVALVIALTIGTYQSLAIYFSQKDLNQLLAGLFLLIITVISTIIASNFADKLNKCKKEIDSLK